MKFFIKDFFSKCDQIRSFLLIFCAVITDAFSHDNDTLKWTLRVSLSIAITSPE